MGKNNRMRRAAKAKQRRVRAGTAPRPTDNRHIGDQWEPPRQDVFDQDFRVRALIVTAMGSLPHDEHTREQALQRLAGADQRLVCDGLESIFAMVLDRNWSIGWQPAEVLRQARRQGDARSERVAAAAIAADDVGRDRATLDARWAAQIRSLGLPPITRSQGWIAEYLREVAPDWPSGLASSVAALAAIDAVVPLEELIPPPGSPDVAREIIDLREDIAAPVLAKVRALLAQAESTTFEAEAATFTAKAQELMARHAIDSAMVWSRAERSEKPMTVRMFVDDPYADVKRLLLQFVASHARCRAIGHPAYAMSSVIGFCDDLDATEVLFTSLLVQAQAALGEAAATAPPGSRTRSRAFRRSFLLGFAHRVDARLGEVGQAVTSAADADHGGALLPVLAARDDAIDDHVQELFGELRWSNVSAGSDSAGHAMGSLAGDRAQLSFGDLDDSPNSSAFAAELTR